MLRHLLLWSVLLLSGASVQAQIVPDGTLGGERSTIVPRASGGESIQGGALRGTNLFHSFSNFNVNDGGQVYFANPTGVQTILTRVTGSLPSNINGTLGVDGSANLFLLNPNGLIFGQNARLDVRGSFAGSTANAIEFGTQGSFSATNPTTPGLLTVQPSALLYTQINAGSISSASIANSGEVAGFPSSGLRVPDGQNLLLVGGDVQIDGENQFGGVKAFGGHIELGGLAAVGSIGIDPQFRLTYPSNVAKSNVALFNTGRANVTGNSGSITVNANTLTASDASSLNAGIYTTGNGGDITVNANTINLSGSRSDGSGSGIVNVDNADASGSTGNILINTDTLNVSSGAQISTAVSGRSNAGNILINAREINLQGYVQTSPESALFSGILTFVDRSAIGNAGDVRINTETLNLSNGAGVISFTRGQGNAGNIFINASKRVSLTGNPSDQTLFSFGNFSLISSGVNEGGIGKAGNTQIRTDALSLRDGATISSSTSGQGNAGDILLDLGSLSMTRSNPSADSGVISSSTSGTGNAGNITVNVHDRIFNDSGFITSSVLSQGIGQGGNIQITAGALHLVGGGGVAASSVGQGNSGRILIDVSGEVTIANSSLITTTVQSLDGLSIVGNAGDIQITAGSLRLNTRGGIFSFNTERGNAGNISIQTQGDVSVDGENGGISSFLFPFNGSTAIGRGGNIQIDARSLFLTNGGVISSVTDGQGDGGSVKIHAIDQVVLDGGRNSTRTAISTSVLFGGVGRSGDIQITTGALLLNNNAQLATATYGQGDSGSVNIQATDQVILNGSDNASTTISTLVGNSAVGRGGNIQITSGSLALNNNAELVATSFGQGDAGNISIQTGAMTLRSNTLPTPDPILANIFRTGIFATVQQGGTGRGGNISVQADSLLLDRSAISSQTITNNGGNLNLRVNDALVLRRGSALSSTAGTAQSGGNGGNIVINAGSVVSVPNEGSYISANAFSGNGGNVSISTNGIFGFATGNQPDTISRITASSQLGVQGQVTINQPQVQPTQGAIELPRTVLDASNQIAQVCPRNPDVVKLGRFTVSGAGSLPPSPVNPLTGEAAIRPLATLEGSPSNRSIATTPTESTPAIVEAQGWVKTPDGKVILVAQTPQNTLPTIAACPIQTSSKP